MVADNQTAAGQSPPSLALSPATTLQRLYVAVGQALSVAANNAVNAQQQSNVTGQASTTQGITLLYSIDTAAVAIATRKELDKAGANSAAERPPSDLS